MKEDITQRVAKNTMLKYSCGLVMKEDITQRQKLLSQNTTVVVW